MIIPTLFSTLRNSCLIVKVPNLKWQRHADRGGCLHWLTTEYFPLVPLFLFNCEYKMGIKGILKRRTASELFAILGSGFIAQVSKIILFIRYLTGYLTRYLSNTNSVFNVIALGSFKASWNDNTLLEGYHPPLKMPLLISSLPIAIERIAYTWHSTACCNMNACMLWFQYNWIPQEIDIQSCATRLPFKATKATNPWYVSFNILTKNY